MIMKKTYITPLLRNKYIVASSLIATSLPKDNGGGGGNDLEEDEILVKGRGTDYNVWNDDWSK